MKICFPARKKGGKEYATVDEIMTQVQSETHGCWLAGTNLQWHGGLHISTVTAPDSVLTADTASSAVPLQFMAGGEVVAWRLNRSYLTSEYNGQTLQYSTTFVLVRSVCQPDPKNDKTWLEFYTLYMGLAPLSEFPEMACWKVTEKGNGIRKRLYSGAEQEGEKAPVPAGGSLAKGARVAVMKQTTFLLDLDDKSHPFGLAKELSAKGEPTGKPFWITLSPEFMTQEASQYEHLPAWMQQAVKQGTFDEVTTPEMKLEVRAGDAVGFLSKDIDPVGMGKVESSHFVHIEVISNDTRMPAFLDNPGGVTTGRQYIRIHSGKSMYQKSGTGEASTFTAMSCVIVRDSGKILPADNCNPLKDAEGQTWYEISTGSWMNENDVDVLHQYDLKARGFTALEQAVTPDMSDSLREGWMKSLLSELSARVNSARGVQQKQVADYYQKAVGKLDTDGDGELSTEELFHAVHHPEMEIRDIAGQMVVRHGSEWFGGSSHHKWTKYFQDFELPRVRYARQWRDDMEWMSHVEAFKSGAPVWHMHPVMFTDAIQKVNKQCYCYMQGIVTTPCTSGAEDVTKNDFEVLASQLGIEREVLRAIAVAETGDKVPFKYYVAGEKHATILYERHFMKRLAAAKGISAGIITDIESSEPRIIHSYDSNYRYGTDNAQYERLVRAREINYDAANMSCSWGKFQVMGEYYFHLYENTKEMVDAQNYCAMQHLQYFKVFLVKEKRMLQSMINKDWLTIAIKYNGAGQIGYDRKIEDAYNALKEEW